MSLREQAAAAALDAATMARMLGRAPSSIYRALDGESRIVAAIIAGWQIMDAEQRRAWLTALAVPSERRRRGRPRGRSIAD